MPRRGPARLPRSTLPDGDRRPAVVPEQVEAPKPLAKPKPKAGPRPAPPDAMPPPFPEIEIDYGPPIEKEPGDDPGEYRE